MVNVENIVNLLTARNMTARQLALKIGITPSGMYKILKEKNCSAVNLANIAVALAVPVCELISYEGQNNKLKCPAFSVAQDVEILRESLKNKEEIIKLLNDKINLMNELLNNSDNLYKTKI